MDDPRRWRVTRGRRSERRLPHRRHHAPFASVRVRPGPYRVLHRDGSLRWSVCRRYTHRWQLGSRRLRCAWRLRSDRRRRRSRRRCPGRGRWSGRRRSGWGCRRRRRYGCGRWFRRWGGRRRGCRGRVDGGTSRRKQRERVDVRFAIPDPYTEMDVRHGVLGFPGRAGRGYDLTLLDVRTALHLQRTEVGKRRLVPVSSRDRDRESVSGYLSSEGDLAAHRRGDRGRVTERDVHATMLSACVLVVAEGEFAQDRPVSRPCPC